MVKMRLRSMLLAGSCALMLTMPALADGLRTFNVPAGDLKSALDAFARQAGIELVYKSADVGGRRTQGVTGSHDARDALARLLSGTGLAINTDKSGAILIAVADNAPPKGAQPAPESQPTAPPDETDSDAASNTTPIEKVTVTGTRVRGAPPPSPVITLDRKDIARTGAADAAQLAETIPQNFTGDVAPGVVFFPTTGDASNFTNSASFNLRGLGSNNTLTLINGVRVAPGGYGDFVDISLIPLSLIDRVEILPDGASAIYGSDAVAGVVNMILRRDFDGVELAVRAGTVTRGDHQEYQGSLALGTLWEGGGAYVAGERYDQTDLDAADRDVTSSLTSPRPLIFPAQRTSLVGGVHQEVGGWSLSGDVVWGRKESGEYPTSSDLFGDKSHFEVSQDDWLVFGTAERALWNDWRLKIAPSYSESSGSQRSGFIGSSGPDTIFATTSYAVGATVSVDGTAFEGPAGPVRFATGTSYAGVDVDVFAFNTAGVSIQRRSGQRENFGVFLETQVPLIPGDTSDAAPLLEASLSVRHEEHDEFGETTNPRLGLIFRPLEGLALRGTWGTSFKVPDLLDQVSARRVALDFLVDPASTNPFGRTAVLVLTGSGADLEPETAETLTAGFDFQADIAKGFTLSGTYFAIDYENRVDTPAASSFDVLPNPASFASIILRDPTAADITAALAWGTFRDSSGIRPGGPVTLADVDAIIDFTRQNIAVTIVRGFDMNATMKFDVGGGDLDLFANVSYLMGYEDQFTATAPKLNIVDVYLRPVDLSARFGGAFSWDRNTLDAALHYLDDFKDDRSSPARTVDSFTTVHLGYTRILSEQENGDPATTLRLDIDNLFDDEPTEIRNQFEPGLNFDPTKGSPRGRFISLQLRQVW